MTESGMLRVCHIISGDLWAGAEVMAYHLLKGLRAYADVDIMAIVLNPGRLTVRLGEVPIRCIVVDEKRLSFFQIVREIKRVINSFSPDVIHSHRYKENVLAYVCALSEQKRPRLFATQHGMPETEGRVSYRNAFLMRINFMLLASRFDKVIAVSRDIQRKLIGDWELPDRKVDIIHNGIPEPTRMAPLGSYKVPEDEFVVGSSGRLVPVKDFPLLVSIARDIAGQGKKIRFDLAGDGPEMTNLRGLIHQYGLENTFRLLGFVDDVDSFYSRLDLYLNTSIHEGIPISVLEAMAHSVPVVASDVGGLAEIVRDCVEGYLISSREPRMFVQKCMNLFHNVELRSKMAINAQKRIETNFSVEQMAKRYYDSYMSPVAQS